MAKCVRYLPFLNVFFFTTLWFKNLGHCRIEFLSPENCLSFYSLAGIILSKSYFDFFLNQGETPDLWIVFKLTGRIHVPVSVLGI
jgi:hypothetical protein